MPFGTRKGPLLQYQNRIEWFAGFVRGRTVTVRGPWSVEMLGGASDILDEGSRGKHNVSRQ